MNYPNWVRGRVLVRAEWDGRPAEVTDLADSLLVLLQDIDAALGDRRPWTFDGVGLVDEYESTTLTALVRGGVERGDDGTEWPAHGYNVLANRTGEWGFVSLSLRVGASVPGRRRPANSVMATVTGPTVDGASRAPSVELVEAVLRAIVRAWDPDTAAAYDRGAARATEGLGRFTPVIGQRAWVSRRIGTIETVSPGVAARADVQGTYLDADDALDSWSAALAVRASSQANGIETIARAA
ncbi:hypothetical protein [Curtobacterium sp. 1544]|uniref:hypothetical protein n=1 Tax=Curtobacterium sp. 1544 TaxID=3156417 RepID=UPI003397F65E